MDSDMKLGLEEFLFEIQKLKIFKGESNAFEKKYII
jgi:hypothetical protein